MCIRDRDAARAFTEQGDCRGFPSVDGRRLREVQPLSLIHIYNPVQDESTMKKHAFQVKRKMRDDICICIISKDVLYE